MAATKPALISRPVFVLLFLCLGLVLGLTLALVTSTSAGRTMLGATTSGQKMADRQTIEWLDKSRSIERFTLEAAGGEFTHQSLLGYWTIVVFGFMHCPDVCPTSLSQLAVLADRMAERSTTARLRYVFVSVDPGRDTVADLNQYVRHFDGAFRGVTGSEAELRKLASSLGVRFKASAQGADYSVAHSVTFSIIGPHGEFRGRFRPGFDVEKQLRSYLAKENVASGYKKKS